MTIDYAELKRLAEAATPGPWSARTDDLCYAVTTLGRFRIIVGSAPADDPEPDALFIAAANPAAVLELIAELESANARLHEVAVACATAEQERDQLKAEVKLLKNQVRGGDIDYDLVLGELAGAQAMLETAYLERDTLKAENEALRSTAELRDLLPDLDDALENLEVHGRHSDEGYRKLKDWYRRVGQACKAIDAANGGVEPGLDTPDELKALRKDAERYRWLRQGKNYAHQYLIDLGMENLAGFDRSIDAAMSKEAGHG
ncbi:ead/Ea22-like family protein [Pseudomonas typographi]|uniref:ead/Ea22-like family protein n=1 Tax=Pseudomonas typographi TaxID=2715964 RepID=UPI0016849133|nr:ead/Ea22-like family protein [Pseudomonas typographi]MBD1555239.1 hypothetical protein [Pseudomonas typographi]